LAALDIDIKKLRIKHSGTSSSFYSMSTSHSVRNEGSKNEGRPRANNLGGGKNLGDYVSDISKSHLSSKRSVKSRKSEMSLEDKLLKGFYKVPGEMSPN
jgi:hypothetical protein